MNECNERVPFPNGLCGVANDPNVCFSFNEANRCFGECPANSVETQETNSCTPIYCEVLFYDFNIYFCVHYIKDRVVTQSDDMFLCILIDDDGKKLLDDDECYSFNDHCYAEECPENTDTLCLFSLHRL